MSKLFYCLDCKRISTKEVECAYCSGSNIKELQKNSPVNVMGSKLKGRVLKIEEQGVKLLLVDENNSKYIKEFEPEKLKKVL